MMIRFGKQEQSDHCREETALELEVSNARSNNPPLRQVKILH